MSRTYRLLVSCDENGSTACHGLMEFRVGSAEQLERLAAQDEGWHTGVRLDVPDDVAVVDVCPACWPVVERRLAEWGRPVGVEAP